jgi:hypothetical protein
MGGTDLSLQCAPIRRFATIVFPGKLGHCLAGRVAISENRGLSMLAPAEIEGVIPYARARDFLPTVVNA